MENRALRKLAVRSMTLLLLVVSICMLYSGVKKNTADIKAETDGYQDSQIENLLATPEVEKATYVEDLQIEEWGKRYIRISKSSVSSASAVYLRDDYMNSSVEVSFEGVNDIGMNVTDILRVNGGSRFRGNAHLKQKKDFVKKIGLVYLEGESGYTLKLTLRTKKIFESSLYETKDAYYIGFVVPREKYDKIVVIDAGHGGMDDGASSPNGRYHEKNYTLLVVQRLKKLFDKSNVKVYYTRLDDQAVSKKKRTQFANRLQADLFVSVHCNASDSWDTASNGVETLYSSRKYKDTYMRGKRLANIMLNSLTAETGSRKRGTIRREGLYLMHHSKVPVSIVEIGYMTNASDLNNIRRKNGQMKIARGIYRGIMSALEES